MATAQAYGVHSEVGQLRQVMVCAPGRRTSASGPRTATRLLFDDVLWVENAMTCPIRRDAVDY